MMADTIRSCGTQVRGIALAGTDPTPETAWIELFNSSSRPVRFERLVLYGEGLAETVELGEAVQPGAFIDLDLAGRNLLVTSAELTLAIDGTAQTQPIGTLGGEDLLWLSIGIDDVPGSEAWVLAWYVQPL